MERGRKDGGRGGREVKGKMEGDYVEKWDEREKKGH